MPKPEFGKKVICNNCEAKFYDLNRKPAICPHCGTEYVEPTNEVLTTSAKQVFVDQVDIVTDDNLVGSDATESIAEDAEIELEEQIDDDTITLCPHTIGEQAKYLSVRWTLQVSDYPMVTCEDSFWQNPAV